MKIAIRYFTRTGNTKKLAEAISAELDIPAEPVSVPLTKDVDILFLCNSVYARGVAKDVKTFLKENRLHIGKLINVSTAAVCESTYAQILKLAAKEKIRVSGDEFHCPGGYKEKNPGRPNQEDIAAVRSFAKSVTGDE